ncbi:MAG TPA: S8 family serine peptidase [Burkholderiaceae bacterium]|nr:S8 family serine peptidase [Burkholderiaceae bacterium]
MRGVLKTALLAVAVLIGAFTPTFGQTPPNNPTPPVTVVTRGTPITPLGWYAIGSVVCVAVSPMIGTVVLGRELTISEAYHGTFGCLLGPVGWLLADALFPPGASGPTGAGPPPPRKSASTARGRHFSIPPVGATSLIGNEVLLVFAPGASPRARAALATGLQLTQLETQTFALTGQTVERWRIDGARSVRDTLLRIQSSFPSVSFGQANRVYLGAQAQPATKPDAAADAAAAQYVVRKLHLLEAHRINSGDNVLVAVIDSKIDTTHPDLAGVIADEYDVVGNAAPAHAHGTAMAGAIAAHSKLVGVAPKVKLLAIRAFAGAGESAQSTTFNILKALDWAASKHARIVNMSFAGPPDTLLQEMLNKANARGIVLIAAVGNEGPRSPPLYPAADARVIGVTATDADDKLMPQANRGPQVAIAAPGVEILAAAPNGAYQVTSGTSVAAAHATGVAALLLAARPNLTPAQVRGDLIRYAQRIPGKRNEVGAGVIDALAVIKGSAK